MAQDCTPCFGTTDVPEVWTGTSALGLSCSYMANLLADADIDTPGCQSGQLTLFQGCGCPAYDEDTFCSMCGGIDAHTGNVDTDGGFIDIGIPTGAVTSTTRNAPVPLFPGKTCEDLLFPRRDDTETRAVGDLIMTDGDDSVCANVQRAANFCGCPGTISTSTSTPSPSDSVCGYCQGRVPQHADARVPPDYTLTCYDWYALAPFYTTEESCAAATDNRKRFIDDASYCGCAASSDGGGDTTSDGNNGVDAPIGCDLCRGDALGYPDWNVTVAPGIEMVCNDVARLAGAATDADFCDLLTDEYADACCRGITPPTASPITGPTTVPDDDGDATSNGTVSPSSVPNQDRSSGWSTVTTARWNNTWCILITVLSVISVTMGGW